MKYSSILLLLFFLGVLAETGLAQRTAQANMTVSANVVKAAEVSNNLPNQIDLTDNNLLNEGSLTLKGLGSSNTLIELPNEISLSNNKGDNLNIDIQLINQWISSDKEMTYQFKLASGNKVNGSTYNGDLKTTIVYL